MNETTTALAGQDMPPITPSSHVKLHAYSFRLEGEEYVVRCPEYSIYLSIPQIGIDALELLQQGMAVSEVAARLQGDEEQPPDIIDFVQVMLESGLVSEIDGYSISATAPKEQVPFGFDIARHIQGKHVRWLFGIPALIVFAMIGIATLLLLWRHPEQIPQPMNMMSTMMLSPWLTINICMMVGTSFTLTMIHECGHILAARAFGAKGRLGFGNRLYYLVSQSHIENIWQLSRFQRLIVYLAGMMTNVVIFFLALILSLWQGPRLPMLASDWLGMIMFLVWFTIGWEFLLYMKTDAYYIIADLFQARNLMDDAKAYLGYLLAKLFPGRFLVRDLSNIPPRERFFVKLYALMYVLGMVYACYFLITAVIPFVGGLFVQSLQTLLMGSRVGTGHWLDAAFVFIVYSIYSTFIITQMWRHRPRVHLRPKSQQLLANAGTDSPALSS